MASKLPYQPAAVTSDWDFVCRLSGYKKNWQVLFVGACNYGINPQTGNRCPLNESARLTLNAEHAAYLASLEAQQVPSAGIQSKRKAEQYEPGQSPPSQQPKVSKVEAEVDVAAEKDEVDSDEPQNVDDSDASDNESEDGDASSEESGEDDSGSEGDKVPIPEHVPSAAPVLHAKPTIKMAKIRSDAQLAAETLAAKRAAASWRAQDRSCFRLPWEHHIAEGTDHFKRADTFVSPAVKRGSFRASVTAYQMALGQLNLCEHGDVRVKVLRNLGSAAAKIVETYADEIDSIELDAQESAASLQTAVDVKFWMLEMLTHFNQAIRAARALPEPRPSSWFNAIEQRALQLVDRHCHLSRRISPRQLVITVTSLSNHCATMAITSLSCSSSVIIDNSGYSRLFLAERALSMATQLYEAAFECFRLKQFSACAESERLLEHSAQLTRTCLFEMSQADEKDNDADKAESHDHSNSVASELLAMRQAVEDITERVHLQLRVCEALRMRLHANTQFDACVHDDEFFDLDKVFEVLDALKQAAILSRETDIEEEAICLAGLGRVYGRLLKQDETSHRYYKASLSFAMTVENRTEMLVAPWYIAMLEQLRLYQLRKQASIDAAEKAEREGVMAQIKPLIDVLRAASDISASAFLCLLYKTHPPSYKINSDKANTLPSDEVLKDDTKLKKNLIYASLFYHPDKNMNLLETEAGARWHALV